MHGKTRLFNSAVEGLAVQLPGWQYPVVCDTAAGKVNFDNYEGRWGGAGCRDASRFIEQALGKPVGETLTTEFYQAASAEQPQSQRQ